MSTAIAGHPRIVIDPERMGGKPCIRRLRFTVSDVLDYLAAGMSEDEILGDFPYLERDLTRIWHRTRSVVRQICFPVPAMFPTFPFKRDLTGRFGTLPGRMDSLWFQKIAIFANVVSILGIRQN